MSNHCHLAVVTPGPNLVDGMQWLQSTFATRFNRLRGGHGHVLQGRYKSILIGEDRPLLGFRLHSFKPSESRHLCRRGLKELRTLELPEIF
jgi:hypothetical protein